MTQMSLPQRANPMFEQIAALEPQWTTRESMPIVSRYGAEDANFARTVGIADASAHRRCGFKGPGTAAWLAQQGLPVPPQANTWLPLENAMQPAGACAPGIVARLGRTEFLIEDALGGGVCPKLTPLTPPPGVYPVLRQDAELMLVGQRAAELLLQTCSIDFAALDLAARPAILTSMVGVGVTVIPELRAPLVRYRIWCDGTYSPYLWETLIGVARDLGGGPVGLDSLT
jgi:sarcosine oxidase, subunit gamma